MTGLEAKQCQGKRSAQRSALRLFQACTHPRKPHRPLIRFGKIPKEWVETPKTAGSREPDPRPQAAETGEDDYELHQQSFEPLEQSEQELHSANQEMLDQEQEQGFWPGSDSYEDAEGDAFRW